MLVNDLARLAMVVGACWLGAADCAVRAQEQDSAAAKKKPAADAADPYVARRNRMVDRHLAERGIKNKRVLDAFRTVPRHKFLPKGTQRQAYDDESIPIGEGQTITPPYDVAFMTEVLDPKPTRSEEHTSELQSPC